MTLQFNPYARAEKPQAARTKPLTKDAPIVLVYIALGIVALIPVFSVDLAPLVDYPNHLARVHVLASLPDTPALQNNYVAAWSVLPNLAADLLLVPIAQFLPALDAGRLFLAATLLLITGGTLALHRTLYGRISLWPTSVFLFLYNYLLLWGFLNYLFTIGLALWALAGWIASERWLGSRRLILFCALSLILFFGHLFAFAIYALTVTAYELWRMQKSTKEALPADNLIKRSTHFAQFVLPLGLWLTFPLGNEFAVTHFGSWGHKAVAALSPVLFTLSPIDLLTFGFVSLVLLYGLTTKSIHLAPALKLPLIILVLTALVMPNWLFGVWGADFRLPLVIVCLGIAGIRVTSWSAATTAVVAVGAAALFTGKIWFVTDSWSRFEQQADELRISFQSIDMGAKILTVQAPPLNGTQQSGEMPDLIRWALSLQEIVDSRDAEGRRLFYPAYWHLPSLAVIDRSVFLPTMFTGPQQPLRAAKSKSAIDTPSGQPVTLDHLLSGADSVQADRLNEMTDRAGRRAYWTHWPEIFDYVLIMDFGASRNPLPGLLDSVSRGSFFTLYAINH